MSNLIKSMILAAVMVFTMSNKSNNFPRPYTFKTEKCIAVANNQFINKDGHIFEINNDILICGGAYWVLFDTYNTKTRIDDDIVDFDTDLYYKWVKYL